MNDRAKDRAVHQSRVASCEESRAWHDEAIRVLAKVRDESRPPYAPCASGPCDGGKKLCPSPQACRLHEHNVARIRAARAKADLPWPRILGVALMLAAAAFFVYEFSR